MPAISMLNSLLPVPREVIVLPGRLAIDRLQVIRGDPQLGRFADDIRRALAFFGVAPRRSSAREPGITISVDKQLSLEGWRLDIGENKLSLRGGSLAGVFYGTGALKQLLTLAFAKGTKGAHYLDRGTIRDAPRYAWRGFMLDSARHFQSVEKIKELIRQLADYRINVLHWHLTDSGGWRTPSRIVPKLKSLGFHENGHYSKAQIREIVAYAGAHFIRIVPELDIPGHSSGLLQAYPHMACNPRNPGAEYCLGNPALRAFLVKLLKEFAALFPDSDVIHIGGDEASTASWEKCPRCKAALAKAGLRSFRALEAGLMAGMSREIVKLGRKPMVWATEAVMPPETIIQGWTSLYDISNALTRGNAMVFSVHHHLYFDYPENAGEPTANWRPLLPEETVYATNPRVHLGAAVDEKMLGVEACLWTEMVPQWRVLQKTLPRLPALGELAWSLQENRNWNDFVRRKEQLEACGYALVRDGARALKR